MRILAPRRMRLKFMSLTLRNSVSAIFARYFHNRTFSKRKSLYDVLDVPHTATQDEIKAAYYELSLKYHPDINKSDKAEHMFQGLYFSLYSLKMEQTWDLLLFSKIRLVHTHSTQDRACLTRKQYLTLKEISNSVFFYFRHMHRHQLQITILEKNTTPVTHLQFTNFHTLHYISQYQI